MSEIDDVEELGSGEAREEWTEERDAAAAREFDVEREVAQAEARKLDAENEAAFGRGTPGVFERRRELLAGWRNAREKICETYVNERETMPEPLAAQRQDVRFADLDEKCWAPGVPMWMRVSGLYPNAHLEMSPNERAGRIRLLLRKFERMVRWELKQRTETALQIENCKMKNSNLNGDDGECSVIEETALWSPVRQTCVYLEVSPRFLSGLCREITGMSLDNIVDRIRAEKLRSDFKKRLKDFVLTWFGVAENWRKSVGKKRDEIADWIFAALKSSRRTRFHRTQWALELGFSSYQRLFRATLLSEGLTPHNLEMEAMEELVPEDEGARCVGGQIEKVESGTQKEDGGERKEGDENAMERIIKEG